MRRSPGSRFIVVLAISVTIASMAAGTASAGGQGKGGSSITLVMLTAPTADVTESGPSFGEQVTFNISTGATELPWVNVSCYQNGDWVYGEWHGFFAGYQLGQTFTLGPTQLWQGGDADCTARLVTWQNGKDRTLASTGFHAAA